MTLKRAIWWLLVLAAIGAGIGWWLTEPRRFAASDLPSHTADLANGELIFNAGGCASCHAAPEAKGEDRLSLGGGLELPTPFGVFVAPNISPDNETGIGGWNDLDFVTAMKLGTSPEGGHYYPAFPYASYARMKTEDLLDLKAFLDTLPPVSQPHAHHRLKFPFNIRRGLGLWKLLFIDPAPVVVAAGGDAEIERGRYLVEGPGHCAECHTPRNVIGGLEKDTWLAGAPNPEGKGVIPNLTPHANGLAGWSKVDIVELLTSGFTPEYDSVGGSMTKVVGNTSRLPESDRQAIAAYLMSLPAIPNGY